MTIHGLLYQSDPEQSAQLAGLFLRSYFLIVPTLAECFGIVFAEAMAFALPPVSRAVHALPSIITEGTGLLFDRDAPATAYVEKLLTLIAAPAAYRAMAVAARAHYDACLTWDRTAEAIVAAMETSLDAPEGEAPA